MYRSSPRPDYGTKIYDFKIELVFYKSNHSASDNIFNICGLNGAMTEICPWLIFSDFVYIMHDLYRSCYVCEAEAWL